MRRASHNSVLRAILLFFQENLRGTGLPDLSGLDGQQQVAGGSGWETDPEPAQVLPLRRRKSPGHHL